MANLRWKGAAAAVAQVSTVTITGYDVTTTYNVTINSKVVSVLGQGGTTATTAAALQAALAASTEPEFTEVTWTVGTTTITGTGITAGIPFTATSSVSGGAGTIGAVTAVTAATGPNHWDNAANWSTGAIPVNGDAVYIEDSSVPILYGLAQSAVTVASLNGANTFTGTDSTGKQAAIGLPEVNSSGSASYLEYRPQYLKIGATAVNLGYSTGSTGQGTSRIKLDTGSVQATLNVSGTGTSTDGKEALQWKGTHASNAVNVTRGSVALAGYGGDVATVATLSVGFQQSQTSDSTVRGGAGLTLTTLNMEGGTVELAAGVTTVNKTGGNLTLDAGNVTTLTDDVGTTVYRGTGTITTANVGNGATLDFSQDMRARTVTTVNLYQGASFLDPFGTVTITNPVHLIRCNLPSVTLDVGYNRNLAVS